MGNIRKERDLQFGDREPLRVNCAEIQLIGCFIYYDNYLTLIHVTDVVSIGYASER